MISRVFPSIFVILLVVLPVFPAAARTVLETDPFSSDQYIHCIESNMGDRDKLLACDSAESDRLDKIRGEIYLELMKTRSPEQQRQLENSEGRWLAWRRQYCSYPPDADDPEQLTETDDLMLYQWCYMDSTLERIAWLKQYLRQEEMPPGQAI